MEIQLYTRPLRIEANRNKLYELIHLGEQVGIIWLDGEHIKKEIHIESINVTEKEMKRNET